MSPALHALETVGHVAAFVVCYALPVSLWFVLWVVSVSTSQAFAGEAMIERRGFQFTILQNALFIVAVIYFPIAAGHALWEHLENTKTLNEDLHGPWTILECIRLLTVSLALSCMCVRVWLLFFAVKLNAILEDKEWMKLIDVSWNDVEDISLLKEQMIASFENPTLELPQAVGGSAAAESYRKPMALPSLHDEVSADVVNTLSAPQRSDKTNSLSPAESGSSTIPSPDSISKQDAANGAANLKSFWLDYEHSLGNAQWLVPRATVVFTLLCAVLVFLWVGHRHLWQEYLMDTWTVSAALLALATWCSYHRVRDVLDIWRELRVIVVASLCFNVAEIVFDVLTLKDALTWPVFYAVTFVWLMCAMLTSLPSLLWPLYLLEKRTHNRFAHRYTSVAQLGRGSAASGRGDSENPPSRFALWPKPLASRSRSHSQQKQYAESSDEVIADTPSLAPSGNCGPLSASATESPSSTTTLSLRTPSIASSMTQSQTIEPETKALSTAMAFSEGALNPQKIDSTPRINDTTFPSPFLRWCFLAFDSVLECFSSLRHDTWGNLLEAAKLAKSDNSETGNAQSSLSPHSKAVMLATRQRGLRPVLADINAVGVFMQFLICEMDSETLLALIEFYQFVKVFGANGDEKDDDTIVSDQMDAKTSGERKSNAGRIPRKIFAVEFPEPRKGAFPFSTIVYKSDATIEKAFLALVNKYIVPGAKFEVNVPYEMRRAVLRLRSKVRAELRSGFHELSHELSLAVAHAFDAMSTELYLLLKRSFDRWSDTLQFLAFSKAQKL